ncbi:MAG: UDP-N-acetylmuramate dehydrogenase [Patescibacteria group bacterium]
MIENNILLSQHTTFKIGGPARFFIKVSTVPELIDAVKYAKNLKIPFFVLGGGSNVLISDNGYKGVVIKIALMGLSISENEECFLIEGEAGEGWDDLVKETVSRNIGGLENLSGIPGSVGATPVQNIGAYGKEIRQYIQSVEAYDTKTEEIKILNNNECQFSYRESIFKNDLGKHFIITKVLLRLPKKEPVNISYNDLQTFFGDKVTPSIKEIRRAVISIRKGKFPDLNIFGTAGSYFKNPIISKVRASTLKKRFPGMPVWDAGRNLSKLPAAYLVDKVANLRGLKVGNASIWDKQAIVLVNNGGATSKDFLALAQKIKEKVKEKTGINLEEEVCMVK